MFRDWVKAEPIIDAVYGIEAEPTRDTPESVRDAAQRLREVASDAESGYRIDTEWASILERYADRLEDDTLGYIPTQHERLKRALEREAMEGK